MKILHIYKSYTTHSTGGVEQLIYELCHELKKTHRRGIQQRVLTISKSAFEQINLPEAEVFAYPANCAPASTPLSFSALKAFSKHVAWADVIHYHFPWPFMDIMDLAHRITHRRQSHKPCIVTYHSDIVKQKSLLKLYKPLMLSFLNHAHTIVATSPNYANSSPYLKKYAAKTISIPIGLNDVTHSTNEALQNEWKQHLAELGCPSEKPFFLFVGVLRYYKGLHYLLEAAQYCNSNIVIAGDGPERTALEEQKIRLGLTNVIFVGKITDEDKVTLHQMSRGFVFPSHLRSEAFGISLLEAAMFSKPMISCRINSGMSYINIHNETGLEIEAENVSALSKAINQLTENPELALKLGTQARLRYEMLFTVKKMSTDYWQIYTNCLGITE